MTPWIILGVGLSLVVFVLVKASPFVLICFMDGLDFISFFILECWPVLVCMVGFTLVFVALQMMQQH